VPFTVNAAKTLRIDMKWTQVAFERFGPSLLKGDGRRSRSVSKPG